MPDRRDQIAAAVTAYNSANPDAPLPRGAARLLTVMFPAGEVCRRSLGSLKAKGFERGAARQLLRALINAGFVSKDPGRGGVVSIYRLHLPSRRQP
jgi:hypothetical protein